MSQLCIAIDAMSGDHGPSATVPAVVSSLQKHPELRILLCGDRKILATYLQGQHYDPNRLEIIDCDEVIANDDSPTKVIREKPNSSMHRAIAMVKEGRANACTSAGNTGALMAISYVMLRTLPSVERPAIAGIIPCVNPEHTPYMLDLGANVKATSEQLVQFAIMGHILSQASGYENPRVAILNIGSEEIKGSDLIRETAERLSQIDFINYVGFIEPSEMLEGHVDVIISDGLIGNFVIKSLEGTIKYMLKRARNMILERWYLRLLAPILKPLLMGYRRHVHPTHYNGATFVGLNGIVIKSHGNADAEGFSAAIDKAVKYGDGELHQRIADLIPTAIEVPDHAS